MHKINAPVTVSIVSHGHGEMVWSLAEQLSNSPSVAEIVVTLNIAESPPHLLPPNVTLIQNPTPLGFGANHNQAFEMCKTPCFCVLNPDIRLNVDPFEQLVTVLEDEQVGVVGPRVLNIEGKHEDSLRCFLTPAQLIKRYLARRQRDSFPEQGVLIFPDWIAGMCMLFRATDYQILGGFDADYFMYCEDADICTRLWGIGKRVAALKSVSVVHDARRASRRSLRHLSWHIASMWRYWIKHFGRLPTAASVIGAIQR